ncbi:unnamed protein product [Prorocentrum cordatum]|uniref:Uncharacterized protein n=1 Tax=Prorocentrum cordatum TaxID=2364126 RepID=A0ABN9SBJ2_9DINO|nr:unnamed protein product [Polarella glacialis]
MASDHDIDMDALHYGFHAAIEQYAVECERALAELDAELGARRRQAVRALAARAAARLTASQGGGWKPGGELGAVRPSIKPVVFDMGSPCASRDAASSDAGQAATLSTLKHGCTRVLCASAAGSPHLVQTVLDDGRSFLTLEPPCMTSPRLQASPPAAAPRPPVPPLDMTKVVMGSPGMASSFGCEGAVLEAADGPLFGLPEDATSDASQEGSTRASSAASRARRKAPPVAGGGGAAGRASASASGAAFGLGGAGGGGHARSAGHVLEVGMAVLVLASAAALGLESSHAARGLEAPPGLLAVEVAFLAACAAELAARQHIADKREITD